VREIPVGAPATALCLLEVVYAHFADAILGADGLPDPHLLAAPARLGDRSYLAGEGWRVVDQAPQQVPEALRVVRPQR
jgi:hypothetical protein